MRTNTLTLQDRLGGKYKRAEVRGIPALTVDQARDAWGTYGADTMFGRITRLEQQHRRAYIRHKAGVITDAQYNRSVSRTMLRLRNIQYWAH